MQGAEGEAELIGRLRERSPEALDEVYGRYGPIIFSLLCRITRNQGAAEDLTQEVFLRVWSRARDYKPERGALGPWILTVARNLGIDYLRSADAKFQKRQQSIDHPSWIEIANKPGQERSFAGATSDVKQAFSSLSDKQKRVMELAYFEGCTQAEIASRLQEPLGTVKSWMRSAIGQLRAAAKGEAQ